MRSSCGVCAEAYNAAACDARHDMCRVLRADANESCMTYKPSNEPQQLCGAWCSLFLRHLTRKNGDLSKQHNNTGWQQRWHTENSTKRSMMSSLEDERHMNSTAYLAAT